MSFHPQTPQSPSQTSPATHPDSMAAANAAPTGPTTLPTPAHSVTGSISHQSDAAMADEFPHKRKRPLDDVGERDHKKVQYDHRLGIEDLHLDVGPKYMLLQKTYEDQFPLLTGDLYEQFDLADLAAEVAREKPNGEKNALRKTYKGHIKRLGVAGHFDVQKKKEDAPSDFMAMLQVPDLEWNVHQVKGREIGDGLSEATLNGLARAMTMSKGPIPRSVWDTSVLGDMAPHNGNINTTNGETSKAAGPATARATAPNTPAATTPSATMATAADRPRGSLPPGADPLRPRRNIKKRTYGDSSYEGYGEGFPDDDAGADTGYSTGEGEGGQKRRKKVKTVTTATEGASFTNGMQQNSGTTPPFPPVRQHSYGPGMVGA
ncbi:Mediator subunit [Cordyceps militaris]|uniref:Mediator of RNA polymerase II transcription subunit 19 n=1 Tax=Cordyceps militaris TaxID=73501 RepID=A0A2H4SAJ9_CORMI|nr:Mediator subunit [Cordyceps militaris]